LKEWRRTYLLFDMVMIAEEEMNMLEEQKLIRKKED
jgi:hypothetical protein